jgi:peptide/nickel transport system substrate-binding protein
MRYILCVALCVLLAACTIEGGVAPPTTPGALPPPPPTPTAAAAPTAPLTSTATLTSTENLTATETLTDGTAALPAPGDLRGEFRIGLLHEPTDLLPYFADVEDQRTTAPVSQLLFPAPLLAVDYTYTTTGVLERVPSLENGDVQIEDVTRYLDESGALTTTRTENSETVPRIVVTYRWNADLRWSDGITVTADDSVFAYELAQQLPLGAEASRRLELTERYERVDDHTTRAILKPDFIDPAFLRTFWTPMPRHLLADIPPQQLFDDTYALLPVGYGPYMLERREQGSIRLRRNPHYQGTPPQADVVSFVFLAGIDDLRASLRARTLDVGVNHQVAPENIPRFDATADTGTLTVYYVPNQVWEHLDFNLDVPLFQSVGMRQAIAFGTNRQQMADTLYGGHVPVLDSWILPEHWAAAPASDLTTYEYDPQQANAMLDALGLLDRDGDGIREQDEDGTPITATLITTDGMPRTAIAEMFQQDMGSIGISVTLQTMPVAALYSPEGPLFRRTFELAQFAWIADVDPRGREIWGCDTVPGPQNDWSGQNLPGWCFFDAHWSIISATTTLDRAERQQAYRQHQQLFTQELPVLPLFQRLDVVLSDPTLHGLRPDPIAPITWNIQAWSRQ